MESIYMLFYLCLIVTYGLTLLLYFEGIGRLQNLRHWLWPSRWRKVKCDGVIWLSIYGFLLIYIVTTCPSLIFQLVKWWILNVQKKLKTQNFNNPKSTFVSTTKKKIQENFGKKSNMICGRRSVLTFWLP